MEQIQKFLTYFGNPLIELIPDKQIYIDTNGNERKMKKINKKLSMDAVLEYNSKMPYAVYFTPNGNYGDLVDSGESVLGIRTNKKKGMGPNLHALTVEYDLKDYPNITDLEELFSYARSYFITYKIIPSFCVKSGGGWHFHFVVNADDKSKVDNNIGEKTFFSLRNYMNLIMDADKNCNNGMSQLYRVPGTKHNKKEPFDVELYQMNAKLERVKATFKDVYLLNYDHLIHAIKYMDDDKSVIKEGEKLKKVVDYKNYDSVQMLKMPDVLAKLELYRRVYKGQEYTFKLRSDRGISVLINRKEVATDGYKYRPANNCVNCFSSIYHPIEERPRGGPLVFLFYYFNKQIDDVRKFLREEFKLDIADTEFGTLGEEILHESAVQDAKFEYTDRRVVMVEDKVTPGGEVKTSKKTVFLTPLKVLGKTKSNIGDNYTEKEHEESLFICENGGQTFFLRRYGTRTEFNNKNKHTFFYGTDNDLGKFYQSIESDETIKDISGMFLSGYYDNDVYLGEHHIIGDGDYAEMPLFTFPISTGKDEISLKEYCKKLDNISNKHIWIPALLGSLAVGGMNLWDKNILGPALLITGLTGSGKSTMRDIFKSMLGYGLTSRQYGLPALTPQPLKQYATDNSILFLEEITENVQEKAEELLRNIVNRDIGARGTSSANLSYVFRSPLFVVGERMFKDKSINNRFVTVPITLEDKKGNYDMVNELCNVTAYKEIYNTYIDRKDVLDKLYKKNSKLVREAGHDGRYADTRGYLFTMLDVFDLPIKKEELFTIMDKNLSMIGISKNSPKITIAHQLKSALTPLFQKGKAYGSCDIGKNKYIYEIMLEKNENEKLRATMNTLLGEIVALGGKASSYENCYNFIINFDSEMNPTTKADYFVDMAFTFINKVTNQKAFAFEEMVM